MDTHINILEHEPLETLENDLVSEILSVQLLLCTRSRRLPETGLTYVELVIVCNQYISIGFSASIQR